MSDLRPRSIKVSDCDWETLRESADSRGESITAYLLRRGLAPEAEDKSVRSARMAAAYEIIRLAAEIEALGQNVLHAREINPRRRRSTTRS